MYSPVLITFYLESHMMILVHHLASMCSSYAYMLKYFFPLYVLMYKAGTKSDFEFFI
jgi:hypothetical protein